MKWIIFLTLLIAFPFQGSAFRIAWRVQKISSLYGFTFYHDRGFAHSFEVMYDHSVRYNGQYTYLSIGFTGSFGNQFRELGLKLAVPPITKPVRLNRNSSLLPYGFVQGNSRKFKKNEIEKTSMNFRPGIGLTVIFGITRKIAVRSNLQIGYTLWDEYADITKGLTVELRIGIGFNVFRLLRKSLPPVKNVSY